MIGDFVLSNAACSAVYVEGMSIINTSAIYRLIAYWAPPVIVSAYIYINVEFEALSQMLFETNISQLVIAFFCSLLTILAVTLRWSVLLKALDVSVKIIDNYRVYLMAIFYGNILPGTIGGDGARILLAKAVSKHPIDTLLTSVVTERVLGLVGIVCFISGTNITFKTDLGFISTDYQQIMYMALILMSVSVLAGGVLIYYKNFYEKIIHAIIMVRKIKPRDAVIVILLSIIAQVFEILAIYMLAVGMGIDIDFLMLIVAVPIALLSSLLPINFAGVKEGFLALLLVYLGASISDASLLSFGYLVNRILLSLVGGWLYFRFAAHRNDVFQYK